MAELVDASDSKSGIRKDVQVRFLFWAPLKWQFIDFQEINDCHLSFYYNFGYNLISLGIPYNGGHKRKFTQAYYNSASKTG
jgi:hypothetical protein